MEQYMLYWGPDVLTFIEWVKEFETHEQALDYVNKTQTQKGWTLVYLVEISKAT